MYEIGVKLLGKGGERLKVSDLATLRICDNLARLNNDLGARVFIPFERIYFQIGNRDEAQMRPIRSANLLHCVWVGVVNSL